VERYTRAPVPSLPLILKATGYITLQCNKKIVNQESSHYLEKMAKLVAVIVGAICVQCLFGIVKFIKFV
jgi:hypothetical protein